MAVSRYTKSRRLTNRSKYYAPLRRDRVPPYPYGRLTQYATPRLSIPSPAVRASIPSSQHIWKYGDRYYHLAHLFYGSSEYWWVIAWFNGKPTETHVRPGDVISVPLTLDAALAVLGL